MFMFVQELKVSPPVFEAKKVGVGTSVHFLLLDGRLISVGIKDFSSKAT